MMEYSYSKLDPDVYTIDGVFSPKECDEIYDEFLNPYDRISAKREYSVSKNNPFWFCLHKGASDFGIGDNQKFISYTYRIKYFIKKILKPDFPFQLERINTNIQYQYQDSPFHLDGLDGIVNGVNVPKWTWTFLFFSSNTWNTEWGGEFICSTATKGVYRNISYIPGRCVLFNGHLEHRGSAPNCFSEMPRNTVAWTFSSMDAHITPDATS